MLSESYERILDFLKSNAGGDYTLTLSRPSKRTSADDRAYDVLAAWIKTPDPIKKIALRSLNLSDGPYTQINAFTATQHFTANVLTPECGAPVFEDILAAALRAPLAQAHLQTLQGDLYVRAYENRDGSIRKITYKKTAASKSVWRSDEHDNARYYLINVENAQPLLFALGICSEHGAIIPAMRAKYRQINHFLAIADQLDIIKNAKRELRIVDCGCGKAYLSLALYYFLRHLRDLPVRLDGIDVNKRVVEFCNRTAQSLGYDNAEFHASTIAEFPQRSPLDLVIALHACDTATDDALHFALRGNARAVLAAPCCHHYVNARLRTNTAPEHMAPLLRDGIARERLADLLTDSLRRDILRAYGYNAALIEFVAPEHTLKNIMITAERRADASDITADTISLQRVREQTELWGAGPYLCDLVGTESVLAKNDQKQNRV